MYNKINQDDIKYLTEIFGVNHLFTEEKIHDDFSHDEMELYGKFKPDVVVEAANIEQISKLMSYANRRNIPVTPRGSGTGLCGGCVAIYGGVLLSLAKMDKIIEWDESNFSVTVEPGVLLMTLADEAKSRGMMYPPDPGEKSASIGGNVMTNAGGMRAIKYGVTRDYVLGMTVVLASGEIMQLGGKVVKSSSGYNLQNLFIGSEGTLGIIVRVILKLIPLPPFSYSILVPYENIDQCLSSVPKVLKTGITPTAIEFMQKEVIFDAEKYLGTSFPDKSGNVYLLLTVDGQTRAEVEEKFETASDICINNGALDAFLSDTEDRQDLIWKARGAFLEAIKTSTTEMDECDVVVPRNCLGELMKNVKDIEHSSEIRIRFFGHAGDGNLHIYLCRDSCDDAIWNQQRNEIMEQLYQVSNKLGGQISGEHGIGHAKKSYLHNMHDEVSNRFAKSIRSLFDPNCILNPGKIYD